MLVKSKKQKGRGIYDSIMNFGARLTDDAANPKNRLFPGEKHALLYRDDLKRYEPAQFMGPGTNLRTRTLMNQMGLTPADTEAKAHDLRYTLGTSNDDIKSADRIFYDKIAQLRRTHGDSNWNLNMANLLKIKDYLPMLGSTFGDKNLTDAERGRYRQQLSKLESMGYGKKKAKKAVKKKKPTKKKAASKKK
jgi:hypothetical protein